MTDSSNVWFCTLTPRRAAFAALLVMMALAFTVFRPPATPGPLERDFEAYYAAGAAVNAGHDPYSRAVWPFEARMDGVDPTRDELLPFVGPAAALPLLSLLARIPHAVALRIWAALLGIALCVLLGSALVVARAPRDPLRLATAFAFTLASAPTLGNLALGQIALISAAGLAVALLAYRARSLPAAILATVVSAIQPNLALALCARMRSRWDALVAAVAAMAFAILTLASGGGVAGFASYLDRLRAHSAAERFITIQYTPAAIAHGFGASADAAVTIGFAIACAAVLAAVTIIVRARLDPTTATLVAFTLLPLAVPFFHEHDFVLEIVPAIVLAVNARGRTRAVAAIASMLVLVDWFGFAQRQPAHGQIFSLGLAVAIAFVGLGAAPRGNARFGLAGIVAVIALSAIASPLGHAHPAPTWPDMLPAAFHADPTADASRVWSAEQSAAGLDGRDVVWGLLRSLPLGGCVLLTFALVANHRREREDHSAAGGLFNERHAQLTRAVRTSATRSTTSATNV